MVWKSREAELPPSQFYADVIGYLRQAFPSAELTKQTLERLAPHLVREWRNGQSARNTAKATCACDGRQITVSPAAEVHVARRAVLPPASASRGSLFGIDELRERREIGTLRVKAAVEERHAEYQQSQLARLEQERQLLMGAGRSTQASKVALKITAAESALNAHRENAARLKQAASELARSRGYWTPPAAEATARQAAAQKRIGKQKPVAASVQKQIGKEAEKPVATSKAPKKKRTPEAVPTVAKNPPKKETCRGCAEGKTPDADLSALVDQFVDAAMKDEDN